VDTTKAEDMRVQHRRLAHTRRRAVTIVTDSSADLPDSVLDKPVSCRPPRSRPRPRSSRHSGTRCRRRMRLWRCCSVPTSRAPSRQLRPPFAPLI
jgi:hypothetical protein